MCSMADRALHNPHVHDTGSLFASNADLAHGTADLGRTFFHFAGAGDSWPTGPLPPLHNPRKML